MTLATCTLLNKMVCVLMSFLSGFSAPVLAAAAAASQEKRTSALHAPTMLLSGHEGAVYSIAFDPSGQHLASASYDRNICKYKDC